MNSKALLRVWSAVVFVCTPVLGLERPEVEFKVFQFPANMIPKIDGKPDDWELVPADYIIGTDQLADTIGGRGTNIDRKDIDVRVRVGWVKGMDKLYFLYEAYDDFWDFSKTDLHNDIFELVVDGDLSGGPFIKQLRPSSKLNEWEAHFQFHGVHAQNYQVFTPALDKDWAMVWGCQPWVKELPYANATYTYDFKPGESGKLVLEFWITPFDYAPYEGPSQAVVSQLWENKIIGMSWSILDYDDENAEQFEAFWNLSHKTTMYGNASDLVAFKLMPLELKLRKPIEAQWSFKVVDMSRRLVAFQDLSAGEIISWKWDFGDKTTSSEQHPTHAYEKPGEYVVTLYVEGPRYKVRRSKVWDVVVK